MTLGVRVSASLLCLAGFSVSCSALNAPDRSKLVPDAGPSRSELLCGNGVDDDNDALTDCADVDCQQQPECCADIDRLVNITDWPTDPTTDFAIVPTEDPSPPTTVQDNGRRVISVFSNDGVPRGLVANDCIPVSLGGTFQFAVTPKGDDACDSTSPCPTYAALVISTVNDMDRGDKLLDDLAVRVYAGGHVEVTQAEVALATDNVSVGAEVVYSVSVTTQVTDGVPTLLARVVRGTDPSEGAAIGGDIPILPLDRLRTDRACGRTPGVSFALEGQGGGVTVGATSAAVQSCVTPSQFVGLNATLMSEVLGFDPSWTRGSIGAPSLTTSRVSPTRVQWDVTVEGSNDRPELSDIAPIGYAVGHARTANQDGTQWSMWASTGVPLAGDNPPSCVGAGPCDGNRSVREPFLYAARRGDDTLRELIVAAAKELAGDFQEDPFALHVEGGVPAPGPSAFELRGPRLSPSDIPDCRSLRDPALIPVNSDASDGFWLLFTCEYASDAPSDIQAVRLSPTLSVEQNGGAPVREMLVSSTMLGAFAAQGVRGAEPVVRFDDGAALLRIWFLATDAGGEVSIGLAEGQFLDDGELADGLPVMTPFPINPILRNSDIASTACPTPSMCSITGIAVTRRIDDPDTLRFLLARHVNMSDPGVDELLALEQRIR